MRRQLLRVGGLATVAAAAALLASGKTARSGSTPEPGDPTQGAAVWVDAGCGACHAFARAGSTGQSTGNAPNLDRWLAPDAARLKLPVDLFAYRRIYYGGRGMTAYGTTLNTLDLDDLVSFVAGHPFTPPAGPTAPVPPLPAPPPLVTASARTVAKWSLAAHLPARAASGAALFAKIGCLSCHTYLGSGTRRRGAPDLSRIGSKGLALGLVRRYLARPYAFGNTLMPAYADLDPSQLASLAAFLAASRGPRTS
ncbi:MAG TPA: c-type cytochrome [Gaiellaceae bacterium]|nr:c-type cytochrome [Gaiellaceae bacterium]